MKLIENPMPFKTPPLEIGKKPERIEKNELIFVQAGLGTCLETDHRSRQQTSSRMK